LGGGLPTRCFAFLLLGSFLQSLALAGELRLRQL
jgi:hypothetical protein